MRDNTPSGADQDPQDVRMTPRTAVNIAARILVRGIAYPVTIHNISRFGAFIVDVMPLARSTPLTLQIVLQGRRIIDIESIVVYWLDSAHALRLRTRAGAGLRFKEPVAERDAGFATAISVRRVELPRAPVVPSPPRVPPAGTKPAPAATLARISKPTLRMPDHAQAALVSETAAGPQEVGGRLVFAGDLATLSVADVLTGLARLRMSGRLEVKHEDVVTTLELLEGDIIDVRSTCDARTRGALLFRLLSWRTGTFRMRSATPRATAQHRRVKVTQLLIEYKRAQQQQPAPAPQG
jgi:hypothetical protein